MTTTDHTRVDPVLIDIPMPIRTPRLILRNSLPGDGAAVYEAKDESFEDLKKWMPWTKSGLGTLDETEKIVREHYAKFILREDMMLFAFTPEGRFIASSGLHRFDWNFRMFEIGYWVRSSEHNKGYASELTNALTRFAFDALEARRVIITAATENAASRRVIEKLGYGLEYVSKADALLPDGSVTGHAQYVRYDTVDLSALDVAWG